MSISSGGAQYVTLLKYFSHPSLVVYSFATPPMKLKLGQQIGGGLLIANHLDEPLRWASQKHWAAAVRSYLLHSFLQVHSAAALFTSNGIVRSYVEPKLLSWPKPACFRFSSSTIAVQDHKPSNAGDARITSSPYLACSGAMPVINAPGHTIMDDGSLMPVPVYIQGFQRSRTHPTLIDTWYLPDTLPGKNFPLADLEFCFQEHKRVGCKQTLLWDSSLW
jgi:hypothetical protein